MEQILCSSVLTAAVGGLGVSLYQESTGIFSWLAAVAEGEGRLESGKRVMRFPARDGLVARPAAFQHRVTRVLTQRSPRHSPTLLISSYHASHLSSHRLINLRTSPSSCQMAFRYFQCSEHIFEFDPTLLGRLGQTDRMFSIVGLWKHLAALGPARKTAAAAEVIKDAWCIEGKYLTQ